VVGTPIGNLEDMTFRAERVLRTVSLIAAEDTRQTRKLLRHYGIEVPLAAYGTRNARLTETILQELGAGRDVALVSDAGMPGMSDPGAELVARARERGFTISCVPGPSAAVAALAVSGLAASAWCFLGFLPRRDGPRRRLLARTLATGFAVVCFESPHRLLGTLADLAERDPDARLVVARELTKIHEEVLAGSPGELRAKLAARFADRRPRGEYTLVFFPSRRQRNPHPVPSGRELAHAVAARLAAGDSTSRAVRAVARSSGVSRQQVYLALKEAASAAGEPGDEQS